MRKYHNQSLQQDTVNYITYLDFQNTSINDGVYLGQTSAEPLTYVGPHFVKTILKREYDIYNLKKPVQDSTEDDLHEWLKMSEPSFEFWDNKADSFYDQL